MLARCGLLGGLFVLAILTSWICREQVRDDSSEAQVEPARSPGKKIESAATPVESLARGDEALQHHFYMEALSHYEELLATDASAMPLVEYRFGLCQELLGQTERALAAYRKLISTAPTPALACAGHLGMARCLLQRNEPALARRLLYPLLFDEGKQQDLPEVFVLDAHYLTALAMAREFLKPGSERLSDDNAVSFSAVPLKVPFHLESVGLDSPIRPKKATEQNVPPLAVRAGTEKQPALVVKTDLAEQPARDLFDQLAKEAGLRIEWSAGAKQTLADRSLHLCVRNWPLVNLLEQAADSFDLACSVEGEIVRLAAPGELDAQQRAQFGRAMTGRALRGAIALADSHAWASAAHLEVGNGEAAQGNVTEAAAWFERLVRETPNSPYVAAAHYNLARLHLGKQDFFRARRAFFRVIDQCPGHELALRAQVRIGQLYLEDDDANQAVTQLRRTQALAPRSTYQALATLILAAAYLQQGQPDHARDVLAKRRPLAQKDPFESTTAFLDSYAQYLLAKAPNSGRREASELLNTLWRDQGETPLGPVGHYLIAQAYRELGFYDQGECLLREQAPQTKGAMAPGLEYLLGDTLLKQNRREEATALFEKLAAAPSPFRARARWQLAQLDLLHKRYQECVQKCQQLWTEQAIADAPALLQLWGAALEGTGDFARAAQCFAGKAPN